MHPNKVKTIMTVLMQARQYVIAIGLNHRYCLSGRPCTDPDAAIAFESQRQVFVVLVVFDFQGNVTWLPRILLIKISFTSNDRATSHVNSMTV